MPPKQVWQQLAKQGTGADFVFMGEQVFCYSKTEGPTTYSSPRPPLFSSISRVTNMEEGKEISSRATDLQWRLTDKHSAKGKETGRMAIWVVWWLLFTFLVLIFQLGKCECYYMAMRLPW